MTAQIIIAEDEASLRAIIAESLTDCGFGVLQAGDGSKCLAGRGVYDLYAGSMRNIEQMSRRIIDQIVPRSVAPDLPVIHHLVGPLAEGR